MGVLDGPARGISEKLIDQFGQVVILRTPGGTYDPATGAVTGSATDITIRALVEDYPAFQTMGGDRESGAGVLAGDKKVTIAAKALALEPVPTQELVIQGKVYGIQKVDAVFSGDMAALYVLQARR